ncbi:NUDIX hydrolase [Clostridium sp. AM58-1XD]|uniref:NUDIX hydrolase n=1 Tax=Clostridium sp. AM58-1XD TaxID=2292307 RepID=UPI000E534B0C|nr:NUDIX hydrolase [Clostridium sp. AM58-1XD]RGY98555.1 NUDIX hydrolase [Clostridium sp. AM58-1XD]
MAILPWKLLSSKTIIKDKWIDLHADSCQLPDGTVIEPFYVNHISDFVVAVAVTKDHDFIMIRQYRHGTKQILLELPAGCTESSDADFAAAAARELLEETGFSGNQPEFLCKIAPNATCISNFAHCYLITGCERTSDQLLDSTEDLEVVVLTEDQLKKALESNDIVQAVHVAALYYAFQRLSVSRS